MSGPSASQIDLQNAQTAFYKEGVAEATTTYGEDQALLKQMQGVYDPILAAGPNQHGFNAEERQELNSQAIEGTARNYKQAAKAVGDKMAARGGGDISLPTGAEDALEEQVGEGAAQEESSEESQIDQADFAEGKSNFANATAALEDVSSQLNPTAYANSATSAGSAAEVTSKDIASESNDWINAAIGAAGAIGGDATTAFCPASGALILMADGGHKQIQLLQVGEKVKGIDGEAQTIAQIYSASSSILRVRTSDGFTTRNSPSHAFLVPIGGYVTATQSIGKTLRTAKGLGCVTAVEPDGVATVYSLITDGSHTYQADGVWALGDDK